MSPLLGANEPPAFVTARPLGPSPCFITCDHASNRFPACLGDLGVSAAERERHIAWDIGALGVALHLAARLDATLIASSYSRLVIDVNRPLWRHDSIPIKSEATEIPGNAALPEAERELRREALFRPYHREITRLLDARAAAGRATLLVSVHSFTPVYLGVARPWQIAILSNRDRRVADLMLSGLLADPSLCVGDNIPYRLTDEGDYGVPVHGEQRGIPHVLIEIRQDQIAGATGQVAWAERLGILLERAAAALACAPRRAG